MTEPPGRVDVDVDVLLPVLHLEEEQLGDDRIRHVVIDRRAEEDDAILQQPRIDVVDCARRGRVCSTTYGIVVVALRGGRCGGRVG